MRLGPFGIMDNELMEREADRLLDRLKIQIPSVRLLVERLSGGQRQACAIARAMAFNSKLIIMDEPTAALSVAAISQVLDLIQGAEGPRRLDHHHQPPPWRTSTQVSDRLIVMRLGRKVRDAAITGTLDEFRAGVVAYMIGARNDFGEEPADNRQSSQGRPP